MTHPRVALAATLHDPEAALAGDVARLLPRLATLYGRIAVATSPPTAARVVRLLRDAGAWGGRPRANRRGPLYRLAIRAAAGPDVAAVHYLDFDRALHWMRVRPGELAGVVGLAARRRAVLVGRTPRAHASHQRALWATERAANRVLAERLGLPGRVDFLVPSFLLRSDAARRLVTRSRARDGAIYGELVALLAAAAPTLAYVECRGLDWETPDRHRAVVGRVGLGAWRRLWDTPAEWALRSRLAADVLRGFARTSARVPVPPPRLVRCRLRPAHRRRFSRTCPSASSRPA